MPTSSGGISEGKEGGKESFEKIPVHIAIIMDGNGRWAEQQGFSRFKGHEQGVETAEEIVTFCAEQGIAYVTLYTFSLDNWKRPKREVLFLMRLLKKFLHTRTDMFTKNNIQFKAIGRTAMLDNAVQKEITKLENLTADFDGMTLCLALSYGGREEIVDATRKICRRVQENDINPEELTPELFETCMQTGGIPHPDILIRTGSEMRLSNFLLWQISYSELFFTDTMWPDFNVDEMSGIIREYCRRERRFGGV